MLASCSHTRITSNGKVPVKFELDEMHQREVVIKIDKEFYLWGLVPDEHILYVDEIVDEAGFDNVSGVTIQESREFSNMLISFLSLGLYMPKTYSISIFTNE